MISHPPVVLASMVAKEQQLMVSPPAPQWLCGGTHIDVTLIERSQTCLS